MCFVDVQVSFSVGFVVAVGQSILYSANGYIATNTSKIKGMMKYFKLVRPHPRHHRSYSTWMVVSG